MSYTPGLLSRFDGTLNGNWNFWLYRSTDSFATVSAPNYFSDALSRGLKPFDLIVVVDVTTPATTFASVLTVTATTCAISQTGAAIANTPGMASASGDSVGVIPPSVPHGWAISANYVESGEVDLWNTREITGGSDYGGFAFWQKLPGGSKVVLAGIDGDANFGEVSAQTGDDVILMIAEPAPFGCSIATSNSLVIQNAAGTAQWARFEATKFTVSTVMQFDTGGNNLGIAISALPGTPVLGMTAVVNNALNPVVGNAVASGGAAKALVWWNGAAWTVMGK